MSPVRVLFVLVFLCAAVQAQPPGKGNGTQVGTAAPTAAPATGAPTTQVPTSAGEVIQTKIVQSIQMPASVVANVAAYTGDLKLVLEASYGDSVGIYSSSTGLWETDCSVTSVASSTVRRSRRVGVSVAFTAAVSAAKAVQAQTQSTSLSEDAGIFLNSTQAVLVQMETAGTIANGTVSIPAESTFVAAAPTITQEAIADPTVISSGSSVVPTFALALLFGGAALN